MKPKNEEEYQAQIPHFCKYRTVQQHRDCLLYCWSILSGRMQKAIGRGVEGPHFCHDCDESIRAKRWDKKWYEKVLKKEA